MAFTGEMPVLAVGKINRILREVAITVVAKTLFVQHLHLLLNLCIESSAWGISVLFKIMGL